MTNADAGLFQLYNNGLQQIVIIVFVDVPMFISARVKSVQYNLIVVTADFNNPFLTDLVRF